MSQTPDLRPAEWSLDDAIERFHEAGFSDGDLITHDWLAWSLAIPEPTTVEETRETQFMLLERVDSFRIALLLNYQVALQSVRGKGYRIVPRRSRTSLPLQKRLGTYRKGYAAAISC